MIPVPRTLVHAAHCPKVRCSVPVFAVLHEELDTTEYRSIPAWAVAAKMNLDECTIYRAIRILHAHGFLERGPRLGNAYTFRITLPMANTA